MDNAGEGDQDTSGGQDMSSGQDTSYVSDAALRLAGIRHGFFQGSDRLDVLRGIDLVVAPGEIVALVGPSGAGKSTLLHIAGLLEKPDQGSVEIAGYDVAGLNDNKRTALRRGSIGFVYQQHHLLPEFSAVENVSIPQIFAGLSRRDAHRRSKDLLDMMGLSARFSHRPSQLSGGEQQRVAIARALANVPQLFLADEPTGNLDEDTAERVFSETVSLLNTLGIAALVATHNIHLAQRMDRVVSLDHGQLRPV